MSDEFFSTYVDDTPYEGGDYVTGEEKEELLKSGKSFIIRAVTLEPTGGYKDTERFLLDITLDDAERKLGFQTGSVDSRDRMLAAMADFLAANPGKTVQARIEAAGRATLVTAAA